MSEFLTSTNVPTLAPARRIAPGPRAPTDRAERLDHRVRADLDLHVDDGPLGVEDADARLHVALVDPRLRELAHAGQIRAIVHAEHHTLVLEDMGLDARAVCAQQVEHLRQVELMLGVLGAQAGERARERARREDEDPGVDLADLALGLGGVAMALGLDDPFHGAGAVAHHPAVAGRILEHGRRPRGGPPRGPAAASPRPPPCPRPPPARPRAATAPSDARTARAAPWGWRSA